MPGIFKRAISNPSLFTEIVRTTIDVDPVLAFYGSAAVAAVVFWGLGYFAFGRRVA